MGAAKLGSSSFRPKYSRPSFDFFVQAAPISARPTSTRCEGAFSPEAPLVINQPASDGATALTFADELNLEDLFAADDFDAWRDAARALAAEQVPPEDVVWQVGDTPVDLFAAAPDRPDSAPSCDIADAAALCCCCGGTKTVRDR